MSENNILERLKQTFGDAILETEVARDMPVALCAKEKLMDIMGFLRDTPALDFNMLTDITAVDYLKYPIKKQQRFEVVYHLYSLDHKHRIRIKVPVGMLDLSVDTLIPLWKTANWLEREVFDMFGITFNHHPNLKRILNHMEFIGHPLRKDYPVDKHQVLTTNDSLMDEMELRLKEKGLK